MNHRGLMLIAGVVLLAGCGAETAAPPVTAATTTTTTPTTTTTTEAPFAAADGTDLQACADGTCEVFVKTGDTLPNASGGGPVQITIQNAQVTISRTSDSGFSSKLTGSPGDPQQINNQVFLIVAVQGEQGLLRLSLR